MPSTGKQRNGARSALLASDMKKSVSFNKKGGNTALSSSSSSKKKAVNGVVPNCRTNGINGDTSSNHDSDCSRSDSSQWYTRPMHLGGTNSSTLRDLAALGVGLEGTGEDAPLLTPCKDSSSTTSYAATSVSSVDTLARDFFPVTLGASYDMLRSCTDDESSKSSHTPSPGTPKGLSNPWKSKRAHSPGHSRKSRPGSAQSSSSSNSKSSIDRMYLMTVEAPNTGSSPVLLSSPYQSELARLRMERLRIEEEHLLELKRQEELERIRGPSPKWYELRSPRFHYEAHKNTSVLKNKDNWQMLMDYRTELEKSSKEYRKSCSS